MTTVTERRIVREITEPPATNLDEIGGDRQLAIEQKPSDGTEPLPKSDESSLQIKSDDSNGFLDKDKQNDTTPPQYKQHGSMTPMVSGSRKPNSAVRQLFPDPRFISPPPASAKGLPTEMEDGASLMNNGVEPRQNYLVTTDSLRLFDGKHQAGKTSNAGARSDSSESDSSIKRTIERNALRRSLIGKYDTFTRKNKKMLTRDLTLEERIKQLTCVDEDQDVLDHSSASANNNNNGLCNHDPMMLNDKNHHHHHHQLLPARTSPSGEERPNNMSQQSASANQNSHHHYHHHAHHHSTIKKITDLFGGKKNSHQHHNQAPNDLNLPDIGLGGKQQNSVSKQNNKLNSEARKQFLASLAPLSCVAANSIDVNEDYYGVAPKPQPDPRNRDSLSHNSDSSYSLEDIDDALKGEGIGCGPPDVTKGTPTSAGPPSDMSFVNDVNDELMAFVEQDKSRTERIRKRYESETDDMSNNNSSGGTGKKSKGKLSKKEKAAQAAAAAAAAAIDEDDDEHNDYGFNRRPSVRSIKPQFETTDEIVRQLKNRSAAANSLQEACRLANNHQDQSTGGNSDLYQVTYSNEIQTDTDTINRINSMQRQINDIYQSIAESSVAGVLAGTERGLSYLESTLPRKLLQNGQTSLRFPGQKDGLVNPEALVNSRMLRLSGNAGDDSLVPTTGATPPGVYSTLPKPHRHPVAQAIYSNYSCDVVPANATNGTGQAKCYRTMYFVPYNGLSDPTYQNLQRMLPPHAGPPANYSQLMERYPYPRNGRIDQQPQGTYYVGPPNVQVGY